MSAIANEARVKAQIESWLDTVLETVSTKGNGKPGGISVRTAPVEVDNLWPQYRSAGDVTNRVFNNHKEVFGEEATHKTRGGYFPKSYPLHLFAGEMDSLAHLSETLRQEIFVHKGLGMVEPNQLKQLLDTLYATEKDASEFA